MMSRVFKINEPWTEGYLDFFEIVFERMGFVVTRREGDLIIDILSLEDEEILNKFIYYDML